MASKNDIKVALKHLREKIERIKEKVDDLCDQTTACVETLCDGSSEKHKDSSHNIKK